MVHTMGAATRKSPPPAGEAAPHPPTSFGIVEPDQLTLQDLMQQLRSMEGAMRGMAQAQQLQKLEQKLTRLEQKLQQQGTQLEQKLEQQQAVQARMQAQLTTLEQQLQQQGSAQSTQLQQLEERMQQKLNQQQAVQARMQEQFSELKTELLEQQQEQQVQMQEQLTELNVHMQQLTEWHKATDVKLPAYTITLAQHAKVHTAVQTQVASLVDSLEKTKAQSKVHPGKFATARLRRHALTLRANSRVKKKKVAQHRMTPL